MNTTPKTIPGYTKKHHPTQTQTQTPQPPQTFPPDQPLSILTRPALPDENPTPAETILEGIIFNDQQEKDTAIHYLNQHLHLLKTENLPLTPRLQFTLRHLTYSNTLNNRILNATLPREDGRPTPAALWRAATHHNTTHLTAEQNYHDLLDQHRAHTQQQHQQKQQQQLTEDQRRQKRIEDGIHDLRVPIKGLPHHHYGTRLAALDKALNDMERWNQQLIRASLPIEYYLQNTYPTLTPGPNGASHKPHPPNTPYPGHTTLPNNPTNTTDPPATDPPATDPPATDS